ncbi:serine/threonine-protein kinase [Streptomyces sp. TLI_146]|uniref:serine/threonine-protein kinase n=1 Tax=Streptomyces sp. TLI_146 TaxID=1938858 RepID=UPI000C70A6BF|nr:serine/threonine-protein kinase [Streptomyces sp. TLI_146]PKV84663.1 serine/threonine protein kinase [Streptomyces sp. TLI_146]
MAEPTLIGGRFAVLRRLGAGGMGEVYEALDTALDRRVAVKLIRSALLSEESGARFAREARALARIDHPNVVTVYEAGVQDDVPYLVMELLEGVGLQQLLRERGPQDEATVRAVAAGVCRALAAVHEAGMVHRDVKPSNIQLTRTGRVALHDFGIAQQHDSTAITQSGLVVGTPAYMAPEQVRGAPSGRQSDMYALGSCVYEMLTGAPPFAADSMHAVMFRIAQEPAPPLHGSPGIPDDLADLVDALLRKDPADRPDAQTVIALLRCPADADALVAAAVTGELRERALESFASPPEVVFDVPPVTGEPSAAAAREAPPWQLPQPDQPLALSSGTRGQILRAMSPEAAEARQREAVNLVLRGSLEEAVQLLAVVAEVWRTIHGPDHPATLTCAYWQGVCLARLGAAGEAVAKFSTVSAASHRALTQQQLARLAPGAEPHPPDER